MSTCSIASDAEEVDPGQRRTTRKPDRCSDRCRENEEESDTAQARAQGQGQLSKAFPQRESRQGQRNAANARERARMRVLSRGFSRLKTSLPWVPADTKLSKLDTLRLASSYISHLRQLLQDERFEHSFVHPVNLTWPFVMSGRLEDHQDHNMSSPGRTLCGASA